MAQYTVHQVYQDIALKISWNSLIPIINNFHHNHPSGAGPVNFIRLAVWCLKRYSAKSSRLPKTRSVLALRL